MTLEAKDAMMLIIKSRIGEMKTTTFDLKNKEKQCDTIISNQTKNKEKADEETKKREMREKERSHKKKDSRDILSRYHYRSRVADQVLSTNLGRMEETLERARNI